MFTANVSKVNPWWLRLLLLIVIGSPIVGGLPRLLAATDPMTELAACTGYAIFVWLVIYLSVGGKQLLFYLEPAVLLALTTAFTGAVVRKLVPALFGGGDGSALMSLALVKLFVTMLTVLPYAIFCINCFSARGLLLASTAKAARGSAYAQRAAVVLRTFQHVSETFISLLDVWREEHPRRVWPRFHADWARSKLGTLNAMTWLGHAVVVWAVALLVHSIAAIPPLVDEIDRFSAGGEDST